MILHLQIRILKMKTLTWTSSMHPGESQMRLRIKKSSSQKKNSYLNNFFLHVKYKKYQDVRYEHRCCSEC
jgi:hypothetical protein